MNITNPIDYMVIGGQIRYFAGCKEGDQVFGDNFIYSNLVAFSNNLERLGFTVSSNLYRRKLLDIQNEYEKMQEKLEEGDFGKLSAAQASNLIQTILEFENTVFAEAETRVIASPSPRRFSLDHLLKNPGGILGQGVYEKLTDLAQYDIAYACRCIAFECPTAAAFHVLRAIEECIRVLFKCYFSRGNECRPWGALTTELKSKSRKPIPDETLLAHLDILRTRFRNPTDHPEKIYEIEEAEDLVHLAVDIINRCARDPQVEKKSI